jgi:hypothetical protein
MRPNEWSPSRKKNSHGGRAERVGVSLLPERSRTITPTIGSTGQDDIEANKDSSPATKFKLRRPPTGNGEARMTVKHR